jgi:drug/metabolite transporter (DMT)-like permease
LAAFRYEVAAALLLGYALLTAGGSLPTDRADLVAVLGGGVFMIAGNGLLFVGQQTVPSGVAAILQGLVPIVTTLWAFLLLDERLSTLGFVGVLLGFLGIGLVVQPDPSNLLAGDTPARLLIVVQVVSVALGGVVVQRSAPSLDQASLTGWTMAIGGLLLHGASAGVGERLGAVPPGSLVAVAYLGVFATALAFFLYFQLIERYGAFESSLVGYVVPLVATVAGVVLLDERVTTAALAGFGVVVLGFVLLKRDALRSLLG